MQAKKLLTITLLIASYSLAWAQVGLKKVAQSTMNFQLVSISPRASSLGEAFCALGTGAEAVFFNPAGIIDLNQRCDLQFYTTKWIGDIDYFGGSFVWNLGRFGALGLSMLNVDYGTIYGTSLITAAEKDLYPLGYKDLGEVKNVSAYAYGLTYGKAISTQFHIAGNLRLVGQNLGQSQLADGLKDNNATKLVFDGGVRYNTGLKSLVFGMAIRNFSSNIRREEIDEQLPLLFTMGIALDLMQVISANVAKDHNLNLAVDFQHPNNYTERVNLGLEYLLWNRIALRAGYQSNRDLASWSAGFGVNTNIVGSRVVFDYSYSNFDLFDGVNRFAIGVVF
jgi:hypothetical protein